MVARGDLGVETDVASVPMVQKRIIRACQRYQKPVIVATQMLDSMQHARRPTRAPLLLSCAVPGARASMCCPMPSRWRRCLRASTPS
jgi:hypothetical protein